jgi:hypothetical protein
VHHDGQAEQFTANFRALLAHSRADPQTTEETPPETESCSPVVASVCSGFAVAVAGAGSASRHSHRHPHLNLYQ